LLFIFSALRMSSSKAARPGGFLFFKSFAFIKIKEGKKKRKKRRAGIKKGAE